MKMGAGRKTQTFTAPPSQDMESYTTSMRNLGKNNLGGVIFGCKDFTIKECLSKQVFGLPAAHFLYVKNISPGLPLFLFNYTNRKLHGIYEAASHGQMNINPYGWSTDGKERTPFPAQVQMRSRVKRPPLLESQFKEIIADNYYTEYHFWFELDIAQTSKLISKFAAVLVAPSVPVPQISKLATVAVAVAPSTSVPQKTMNWRSCFSALPSNGTKEAALPSHDMEEAALPSRNTKEAALPSHNTKEAAFPSHDRIEEALPLDDTIEEPEWLEKLTSDAEELSYSGLNLDAPVLFGCYGPLKSQFDVKEAEQVEEEETWEDNENSWGTLDLEEKRAETPHSRFEEKSRENPCFLSAQKIEESLQLLYENQEIIAKLIQEVNELKAFKIEHSKKMDYTQHKLKSAEMEIQRLKGWFEG